MIFLFILFDMLNPTIERWHTHLTYKQEKNSFYFTELIELNKKQLRLLGH